MCLCISSALDFAVSSYVYFSDWTKGCCWCETVHHLLVILITLRVWPLLNYYYETHGILLATHSSATCGCCIIEMRLLCFGLGQTISFWLKSYSARGGRWRGDRTRGKRGIRANGLLQSAEYIMNEFHHPGREYEWENGANDDNECISMFYEC